MFNLYLSQMSLNSRLHYITLHYNTFALYNTQ